MKLTYLSICILIFIAAKTQGQNYTYTNQTEVGLMIGFNGGLPFTFQTFNGIKLAKSHVAAGLTTGVDVYEQMTLLPVALGLRYSVAEQKKMSYYLGLDAGYGLDWLMNSNWEGSYNGGWMLNPAVGIKFQKKKKHQTSLSIGYRQQLAQHAGRENNSYQLSPYGYYNEIIETSNYTFNRLSLRIGVNY